MTHEVKCPNCGHWTSADDTHCSMCNHHLHAKKEAEIERQERQRNLKTGMIAPWPIKKGDWLILIPFKFLVNWTYYIFMAVAGFLMWLAGTAIG